MFFAQSCKKDESVLDKHTFSENKSPVYSKPQLDTTDVVSLIPEGVKNILDQKYPRWKVVLITSGDKNDGYSNYLISDFDADGHEDIALHIGHVTNHEEVRWTAIAFLKRGGTYEDYYLSAVHLGKDRSWLDKPSGTVLRLIQKGESTSNWDEWNKEADAPSVKIYDKASISVVTLDKASVSFEWDGSGFTRIITGD
ncbi:MAG: hypothetical protein A2901_03920 [Elusimicrobia bacterium RIFCSPLOWO2_01_FULL_54_10]|nr:MAG: hypothetical protein A2901_03920 [Elusimicrobia bacterium RIFCSPLOWO2_01_FULL_54_10]